MKLGIIAVELILLDDHPLVLQKDFELFGLVDAERMCFRTTDYVKYPLILHFAH